MSEKLETVKIEFEVACWTVPFLKEYLSFLGCHGTSIEDVAREGFFEELCKIRDELQGLVYFDRDAFFKKYHDIATLQDREEQKRLVEMERRNDC